MIVSSFCRSNLPPTELWTSISPKDPFFVFFIKFPKKDKSLTYFEFINSFVYKFLVSKVFDLTILSIFSKSNEFV